MASIHKEVSLSAATDQVWDVVRDVGAVHTRFAPGFVTDTVMDGPDRIVTFANGLAAREVIIDIDDARRRETRAGCDGDRLAPGLSGRRARCR